MATGRAHHTYGTAWARGRAHLCAVVRKSSRSKPSHAKEMSWSGLGKHTQRPAPADQRERGTCRMSEPVRSAGQLYDT